MELEPGGALITYYSNQARSVGNPFMNASDNNGNVTMAEHYVLSQRLVHLVDEAKRNELMIIYMEDLSEMGLTAADLAAGGKAAAQWDEVSKGLLERAVKGLKISR